MAKQRTLGALSVCLLHGEVRAAFTVSRIAQLYAEPQEDGAMAPGPKEPPRRGKPAGAERGINSLEGISAGTNLLDSSAYAYGLLRYRAS